MADITSKAAMAPAAPKAADGKSASDGGGHSIGGFSSLPSSIHHGLSEKLQGFTEKLQQLGQKNSGEGSELASNRSRTSSWGTGAHPSLAVKEANVATNAQCQSPSRTCSRTSSKKSNQSTLISNGKVSEGISIVDLKIVVFYDSIEQPPYSWRMGRKIEKKGHMMGAVA